MYKNIFFIINKQELKNGKFKNRNENNAGK